MQGAEVLLTIAEIAVAFAGFASVVVLFQQRDPGSWPEATVIRLRTMIEGSLLTLFAALLPLVLGALGLAGEALWRSCSLALAIVCAMFGVIVWRRSRAPVARGELSRSFTTAVAVISGLVLAALVANAAASPFGRSFGVYLLGLAWTLVFASLMFLRLAAFPAAGSRGGPQAEESPGSASGQE